MYVIKEKEKQSIVEELTTLLKSGELTPAIWREFGFVDFYNNPDRYMDQFTIRNEIAKDVCWFLPTKKWIDSIQRLIWKRNVLEVCAGNGTLAQIMKDKGLVWHATDQEPGNPLVEEMLAEDALTKECDVIFASWIPYQSDIDQKIAATGKPAIIVGETQGGCTGSKDFWKLDIKWPSSLMSDFEDVITWYGIHDCTYLVNWRNQ